MSAPLPPRAAAPRDGADARRTERINLTGPNMTSWPPQQTTSAVECRTPEMPLIAPSTQALEQDALLDALLFMDDFDLSHVDLMATDKPETTVPIGPFCSELLNVDSIDTTAASSPASLPTAHPATSVHMDGEEVPRASPTPSSPPASVTSSVSPPASPSAGSDAKSTASSSPTKRKGIVNHSRNRRREELQYLRSLVGELEDRLTTLHKRVDEQQQHDQTRQLTNGEDAANSVDDPVLTSVWETLASRQYAQRQRAEGENSKLRRMLEDQIQVGKSLERLLKRRHNADDLDMYLHGKRPRWTSTKSLKSTSTQWNKAAIYDELLATLPVMYDELQSVFQKIQFDRSPVNFRDIQVRNEPEQGVVIDVMESHVYPFDYALTSQHFWALFCSPIENERLTYHDAESDENTLKIQFGGAIRIARAHGKFDIKLVSRRFVEANRTVIVWVGLCDPTEIAETNMDGIYMRYKGWNIIEPLVAPATPGSPSKATPSAGGMGTRIKSYSFGVPEAYEDIPDQKRKVGTLTNFMLSTLDVQSSARQQQLENTLVQLSLR